MPTYSLQDPHWVKRSDATEFFSSLQASPLAEEAKRVEVTREKYVSILEQREKLELRRLKTEKAGEEAIRAYQVAYGQLFLKRVRNCGKEYCTIANHVVSEVTPRTVWNHNCMCYSVEDMCPECIHIVEIGDGHCGGNKYEFIETKEEGGVLLRFRNGEWKPMPTEHFYDYTSNDANVWIPSELGKEYGMPPQLKTCG